MQIDVNGARMWFEVTGPSLVPDGAEMRRRPTLLVLHGGPAGYDHSYLRPHLDRLAEVAQVVYVDLPGHGRSDPVGVTDWSLERCADDLRRFCDHLGIDEPLLFGHSMGGFVALHYALRHPGHARGLLLQATAARHDVDRIVTGFRARFGDELAEVAARVLGGQSPTTLEEHRRVLATFGPNLPDADTVARIVPNPDLQAATPDVARFDVVGELWRIDVPTLVTVGALDPVTPVVAAEEIAGGLPASHSQLEVLDGAGHFPWLDDPVRYWPPIEGFIERCSHAFGRPAPVQASSSG
jgi:pimeloyl-ACP methyl ester carboxylesterase